MRAEPKFTRLQARILGIIADHPGKANAISSKVIAKALGVHDRAVRKNVSALIYVHREPIGSSYDQDRGGFYWIATKEEAAENWRVMRQHGVRIIKRGSDTYNISAPELLGQIALDLREMGSEG